MIVFAAPLRRLRLTRRAGPAAPVGFLRADAVELLDVVIALATAAGR